MTEQAFVCKEALNDFSRQRWPDHSLTDIKFPSDWRKQLVKVVIHIMTVEQLWKELLPACYIQFPSLEICA